MKEEVYKYQRRLECAKARLFSSNLDEESKQKVMDFYRDSLIRGIGIARLIKYIFTLRYLGVLLGKPFSSSTKEDIAQLIGKVEEKRLSAWAKHDFKVILKLFYRWLRKTERYPEEVSWIRSPEPSRIKLPEELLTPEEVMRMVNYVPWLRDKAFILTLYETGCRIGELLTMQIKHVAFDKYGAILHVDGKTGPRRVRIIVSVPKLCQWIENHPKKDDPEAPLWITIGTNSRYQAWSYGTARAVLSKTAKMAGIKKRVYPHLFRHTRATYMANHLTEAQMKHYFGWKQSSDMAAVYVHLSGRDVDNALLKLNGISVEEETMDDGLQAAVCPRCKTNASPDAKFCPGCGLCIDEKVSMEIDDDHRTNRVLEIIMKDSSIMSKLIAIREKNARSQPAENDRLDNPSIS